MNSKQLRRQFIEFFKKHGHAEISGASIIPENDPTVLFTTAGMHPLVPYLLGEAHPQGKRLTDVQKCLRTDDIDEVGDTTHLTFFEMLGNWSLGDYFKKEAIAWSYEFLTSPIEKGGIGFDPNRLHVTCFAGDQDAPKDEDAAQAWEALGFRRSDSVPESDRLKEKKLIYFFGKKENWWGPAGQTGPCGPDSEMFFERDIPACSPECSPACDCGKFVEIWNDVFMQYNKNTEGKFEPLKQQNVDTGMGLERATLMLQGVETIFETDLFAPIMAKIAEFSRKSLDTLSEPEKVSFRIIADHLRGSVFLLADPRAVRPSNTDQGYVLRRLIRRAIRHGMKLGIEDFFTPLLADTIIEHYGEIYPELVRSKDFIRAQLQKEESQFRTTLVSGEREFVKTAEKLKLGGSTILSGEAAFHLYDTYGFPLEMTKDLAKEHGLTVDAAAYETCFKAHQDKSRSGASQKFAGGMADASDQTVKLHTSTHLLQFVLREVLGDHVYQMGSNITPERLRFDFTHSAKMTPEQVKAVEARVNELIQKDLPISFKVMTLDDAKCCKAIGVFPSKYDEKIKVYSIGDTSIEICGGPHVAHTGLLGTFKILKEESSSSGVRRIKATVSGGPEKVEMAGQEA
ncbi:MAG: alanine--tRNA ligase [Candidatus Gracilibacteria bacterium]